MSRLYSWSRFAGRTAAAAAGIEGTPTKLTFVVTKRCYSRCVYCEIWKVKDAPGGLDNELSLDEVRATARANPFLQWIDFTGGEPTDRPDFVPVVQAFAGACPDLLLVHFPTNGLATTRIHDTVVQLRKTVRARLVVSVSVDGPPELNDRLRGVRNDFAHAIDTFAAVRGEIGPENTYLGMTLHGHKASCGRTTAELVEDTFAAVNAALVQRRQPAIDRGTLHLNIPHFSQHFYGNRAREAQDGFGGSVHRAEISAALAAAAARPGGLVVPDAGDRADLSRRGAEVSCHRPHAHRMLGPAFVRLSLGKRRRLSLHDLEQTLGEHPRFRLCADADPGEIPPRRRAPRSGGRPMPRLLDPL